MSMDELKKFFARKKILITGHTGFKGGWLASVLHRWGADVSGISLLPDTTPNLFDLVGLRENIRNHFADIRDFIPVYDILRKEKPEIIFHLAAQPLVREGYRDPLATFSTNVMGTVNVLEAARRAGSLRAFVVVTTDKVYDDSQGTDPYKENNPLGGHDPYSASKAAADIAANAYIESYFHPDNFGKTHRTLGAVVRAGNVIGGGDWGKDRLFPDILRSVYEKKEKVVIRNPLSIRPWQYVLEPLHGYLLLSQLLYTGDTKAVGAWNFGPSEESFVSVEDVVKKVFSILGKGEYEVVPDASLREAPVLTLDSSRARDLLGWRPRFVIDDAIRTTVNWYTDYYGGHASPEALVEKNIAAFFS